MNVDDIEAGSDIPLKSTHKCTCHWQSFWRGEAVDIVHNTTRGSGLEAWNHTGDPVERVQTEGGGDLARGSW